MKRTRIYCEAWESSPEPIETCQPVVSSFWNGNLLQPSRQAPWDLVGREDGVVASQPLFCCIVDLRHACNFAAMDWGFAAAAFGFAGRSLRFHLHSAASDSGGAPCAMAAAEEKTRTSASIVSYHFNLRFHDRPPNSQPRKACGENLVDGSRGPG